MAKDQFDLFETLLAAFDESEGAPHEATSGPFDCAASFEKLMSFDALRSVFDARFSTSSGKGIDRVNGFQFGSQLGQLEHASKKCLAGSYRFTSYREVLQPKGRESKPRLISIPTIRDRIIIHQIKELLALAFPECIPKNTASAIVRTIAEDLPNHPLASTFVAGCDIRSFYDTLHRDRLLTHLRTRISDSRAMKLIESSIVTPTVPPSTRRIDYSKFKNKEGVPQGLATSNIMAAIYLSEIDDGMRKLPVKYHRYVDDVLIYGTESEVVKAQRSFINRARRRGLSIHKAGGGKTHLTKLTEEFRYLGYVFKGRQIGVRSATIERLLRSLAAKFSDFRHNKERRLQRHKFLNEERIKDIFLLELNERITGAVKDNRRYGWVAYFSHINELSLLHRLDSVVRGMFSRMPEFGHKPPSKLRSFSRAFFEIKYRPRGGYVRNFDLIATRAEKLQFLVDRGRVGPDEALTDDQIDDRFDRYVHRILGAMQADEANIY